MESRSLAQINDELQISQVSKISTMYTTVKVLVALVLLSVAVTQRNPGCLNHKGEVVDWFVVYPTTKTTHDHYPLYGYLYIDSNSKKGTFDIYQGYGNEEDAPIGLTIAQSKDYGLGSVAWNDQLRPDQGTGNSNRAHSKFYMALTSSKSAGFAVVHSIPEFPSFEDDIISPIVADKQKVKAQHQFCFTIRDADTAKRVYENSCFIRPTIYQNNLFPKCQTSSSHDLFKNDHFTIGSTQMSVIYKNGDGSKADIFDDGIVDLVESSIIAQTFGSPAAFPPACDQQYHVGNSDVIAISTGISWKQGSDHSKWCYALDNDFACFGDLNRNTEKQRERGGAFYCIDNKNLNSALKGINPNPAGC